MSFSSTAIQAISESHPQSLTHPDGQALMAAALVLSVAAVSLSRKELRRLKRRALWAFFKAKVRGLFGKRDTGLSTKTLLLILIGLGVLILAFVAPVVAIILLLLGIVYLLLSKG